MFVVLFAFAWVIYTASDAADSRKEENPQQLFVSTSFSQNLDRGNYNAFFYSLDVLLPVIDFHQNSVWIPNANGQCKEDFTIPILDWEWEARSDCGIRLYRMTQFFKLAGWVLVTLAVAAITGIVKRF